MIKWLNDVWYWLTSFPRLRRRVTINGSVLNKGGTIYVGKGVHVEILGNLCLEGSAEFRVEREQQ